MSTDLNISITSAQTAPIQASFSQTRSTNSAHQRVENFIGHSYALLAQLEEQNTHGHTPEVAQKINAIYLNAANQLFQIEDKMKGSIQDSSSLSKKEVTKLAHTIKTAEKEIAKVLQKTQTEVAAEIGSGGRADLKAKIETLTQGGFKAKLIGFLSLVSATNKQALEGFKQAKLTMEAASKRDFAPVEEGGSESKVHKHQRKEFKNFQDGIGNLKRRTGVIGLNGVYRVQVSFSNKAIHKQLKSFIAQNQSHRAERVTIARDLKLQNSNKETVTFQSKLVPLNKEFDDRVQVKKSVDGATTQVFEKIFGKKGGISSANRQEPHLVNGWESNLINKKGQVIYQALRHAITSDKFETNKEVRKANSEKAAAELIKAALLQQLSAQGLSLEEAAQKGVTLNLNSVSLVTPDDFRAIGTKGANEKTMLFDQIQALHSFEGAGKTFKIDGIEIPLNLNVNTFNFGVNAGAVGALGFGTINQYEGNVKAFNGLMEQVKAIAGNPPTTPEGKELVALLKEIRTLMADRQAYLDGDNQYEIGAKIINLSNMMDRVGGGNTKAAFNCMSGKDRTGMMDGVAKAFAAMGDINGKIPTHEELKNDEAVRTQFRSILVPILLEMGGIEITEINTSATGYKVGKEAQLANLPDDKFLEMLGLAKTTSS